MTKLDCQPHLAVLVVAGGVVQRGAGVAVHAVGVVAVGLGLDVVVPDLHVLGSVESQTCITGSIFSVPGFPLIVTPVIVTKSLLSQFSVQISKLSDIVTIGYCDTFRWSQHCHNKREALYMYNSIEVHLNACTFFN